MMDMEEASKKEDEDPKGRKADTKNQKLKIGHQTPKYRTSKIGNLQQIV